MLEHRGDAGGKAVSRAAQPHRLTRNRQMPRVGPVHPGQHRNDGGFARAVLAQQDMHLARPERQRDIVHRQHAGKPLRDTDKGDRLARRGRGMVPGRGRHHSATVTSARRAVASKIGSTMISPAMIRSRTSMTSAQAASST